MDGWIATFSRCTRFKQNVNPGTEYNKGLYIPWVMPKEDKWGMGSGCRR